MEILNQARDSYAKSLTPMQATLELTYRCNERCGHCYLATYDDGADGRPPLGLDEWKRVLDELAQAGTLLLVLIGGEAMLHPHFWEIAAHAAGRGFAISLITNGLLIDERAAARIAELGFYQVTISLYSAQAEIHDRMTRRKGSHLRTVSAVERLRSRGINVGVNCLLTRDNIDSCFELESWAKERSVPIQFDPMVTARSDAGLESTLLRATPEQLMRYYRALKAMGRGPQPSPAGDADDPVCNAGRGKCAINVYGDLLTCLEVREPLGNLRDASFEQLWRSPRAEAARGLKNRDLKFDGRCGDGEFCDHCPGMARAETGDLASPVPFLMELARVKRLVFETDQISERGAKPLIEDR